MNANKYVRCENGHQYDPKKNKDCPYCPKPDTDPKVSVTSRQTPPADAPKVTVVDRGDGANPAWGTTDSDTQPGTTRPGDKTILENGGSIGGAKTEVEQPEPEISKPPQQRGRRSGTLVLPNPDEPGQVPIFGWLVILEGNRQYEVLRINQEQSYMGTNVQCDIIIEDDFVSSEHASIRYRDGRFFITDLDSKNGTFVNNFEPDASIDRVELKDGDEIHLGQTVMIFKCL